MKLLHKFNFWALPIAGISLAIWIWLTQNGFGLTTDAKAYLYAAESFRKQGELLTPQGYYTNWTPLFPFLLSFMPVKVLFGATLLLNLFLLYWLVHQTIINRFWQTICYLHTSLSVVLVMVHFFVWSEALFLTFLLAITILFLQMLEKERSAFFYSLILLSNLLCLQRMAGIFFVIAFALLFAYYFSWEKAFRYFVLSSLGLGLWLVRNSFLQGKPDFLENIWAVTMSESFIGYAESFVKLFVPTYDMSSWLVIVMFIVILIGSGIHSANEKTLFVLFFLFFFYFAVMLALSMNIPFESDRYASPVMPFLQILFWKRLNTFEGEKEKFRSKFRYFIMIAIIAYNLFRTYWNVQQWRYFPPLEMYKATHHKFWHIRQGYFANYVHVKPKPLHFQPSASSNQDFLNKY
jgi:hypothetical protein